jgi:hypothetical protein
MFARLSHDVGRMLAQLNEYIRAEFSPSPFSSKEMDDIFVRMHKHDSHPYTVSHPSWTWTARIPAIRPTVRYHPSAGAKRWRKIT